LFESLNTLPKGVNLIETSFNALDGIVKSCEELLVLKNSSADLDNLSDVSVVVVISCRLWVWTCGA